MFKPSLDIMCVTRTFQLSILYL